MNTIQSIVVLSIVITVGFMIGFLTRERVFASQKRAFQMILDEERKYADEVVEKNKALREKLGLPEDEEYRWV